ncbi:MAG TPA: MFS transporter [Burkholderiales bacterium]|jgi:YNFM family putative membrane transporter
MSSSPAAATHSPSIPDQGVAWIAPGTRAYYQTNLALFLAGVANFSLLYCTQPLLPLLSAHFHIGVAESSLAVSVTTGVLAFAVMAAGAFSESVGRRGLIFWSLAAAALLTLCAAFAPSWHLLLAARAVEGVALGGVSAVAMAYLAEEIDPRGLGTAMGLYVSASAIGGMGGRVLVSVIADHSSWQVALASISVIGLLSAVGFFFLLPPSRHFVRREGLGLAHHLRLWGGHLRHPGLPLLFAMGFLGMGVFVTLYNYASFRLMEPQFGLSQTQIGFIFTAYLCGMVSSSIAGAWSDRIGRAPVLVIGVLVTALGVGLTCVDVLASVIGGIAVVTVGFFMVHTVCSAWIGRLGGAAKAYASSLYLLSYYLGSSVLGSFGGWFLDRGGWNAVVGFALASLAVALVISLRLGLLTRRGTLS